MVAFLASSAQLQILGQSPRERCHGRGKAGRCGFSILGESGKLELVVMREGLLRGPYLLAGGREEGERKLAGRKEASKGREKGRKERRTDRPTKGPYFPLNLENACSL